MYLTRANGHHSHGDEEDDDDDDSKSIATLMDSEDAEERVRLRRKSANGHGSRSKSPATDNGAVKDSEDSTHSELTARIDALSSEINEALQLSQNLQAQHAEAMSAVRVLTQRIGDLENGIANKVSEEVTKAEQRWEMWRMKFEDGWRKERESWDAERERLRGVVREWEEASRRGREEVEERELNESLSGGELEDEGDEGSDSEEEDEEDASVLSLGQDWKQDSALELPNGLKSLSPSRRTSRRRRPSHRTTLAVRALKNLTEETGSSTPKAETQSLARLSKAQRPSRAKRSATVKGSGLGTKAGTGVGGELSKNDNSSESGRESGDTLRESDKSSSSGGGQSRKGRGGRHKRQEVSQNLPVFTVLVVAVVAGALYYKNRE